MSEFMCSHRFIEEVEIRYNKAMMSAAFAYKAYQSYMLSRKDISEDSKRAFAEASMPIIFSFLRLVDSNQINAQPIHSSQKKALEYLLKVYGQSFADILALEDFITKNFNTYYDQYKSFTNKKKPDFINARGRYIGKIMKLARKPIPDFSKRKDQRALFITPSKVQDIVEKFFSTEYANKILGVK